jgi:polyisoprenoid-binding protein YceI
MSIAETPVIEGTSTWRLDPVHSTVGFEVAYLAGTFKGTFREINGEVSVREGHAVLRGAAQVASVDVKDENLAADLQSPQFFDAERHPELRFAADDLRIEDGRVTGSGRITIKGNTRPIEVEGTAAPSITDAYGKQRIGLTLTAAVDRTDFGLNWNNPLPSGEPALANDVSIVADLQFVEVA